MEMQHLHLNSSNNSFSDPSNKTAPGDWDFSFSEETSVALFLAFLGCVLFSSIANGLLFFVTVRYKQQLWQPQYILLKNISACGFGMTFIIALIVLSAIVQKQTQIYGCWCIVQFCILRCFFLISQMTLALMAVERYIFICHGIHYLRMVNTGNVHISLGLIWLVSVGLSFHGGMVLSQIQCGFQQQTSGLLCNAVTIKEHIKFSWEDNLLAFGPPSVITTFCILAICYCYGCMYHAALRVSKALKCNNHRANVTAGLYFLLFLLQLAPSIFFIILTMMGGTKVPSCRRITPILTPLLLIIPSCINAAFLLIRNPQIRKILLSECWKKCQSTEVEVLHLSAEEHRYQAEDRQSVERETLATAPPPLPGHVFPSSYEDYQ